MAIYSLAQRTTVTTIGAASHAFLAPATNEPALMEWGYFNGAATACVVGFGRTANTPTLTGGVAAISETFSDGTPVGLTQGAVAFGTAPTVPTQFFRRFSLAALVGAAVVYTFPRGIALPAGGQAMCAWNITANSAVVDVHFVVDE
jgi:hypothetical protein